MSYPYQPDYAVHPGELVKDALAEADLKQRALCELTGYSEKYISQLCKGKARLTAQAAVTIGGVLHINPRILLRLQANYDVWKIELDAAR